MCLSILHAQIPEFDFQHHIKLAVVTHAYTPVLEKKKERKSELQGYSQIYS